MPLSDYISQMMLELGFNMRGGKSFGIKLQVQAHLPLGEVAKCTNPF